MITIVPEDKAIYLDGVVHSGDWTVYGGSPDILAVQYDEQRGRGEIEYRLIDRPGALPDYKPPNDIIDSTLFFSLFGRLVKTANITLPVIVAPVAVQEVAPPPQPTSADPSFTHAPLYTGPPVTGYVVATGSGGQGAAQGGGRWIADLLASSEHGEMPDEWTPPPTPPEPEQQQRGDSDDDHRAAATAALTEYAHQFINEQIRYELAMRASNGSQRALDLLSLEAEALGVQASDLAAAIVRNRELLEETVVQVRVAMIVGCNQIAAADGDGIAAAHDRAVNSIRGIV